LAAHVAAREHVAFVSKAGATLEEIYLEQTSRGISAAFSAERNWRTARRVHRRAAPIPLQVQQSAIVLPAIARA
jgi:hypothetical protein